MTVFSYSQARQNLSSLLNKAKEEGEVYIKRRDGSIFLLKSIPPPDSPLDVDGIDSGITRDEIVTIQRESRKR